MMEGSNKPCNNLRLCIISGNFVQVHHLLYLSTFKQNTLKIQGEMTAYFSLPTNLASVIA